MSGIVMMKRECADIVMESEEVRDFWSMIRL
jgi:hypothetical protein